MQAFQLARVVGVWRWGGDGGERQKKIAAIEDEVLLYFVNMEAEREQRQQQQQQPCASTHPDPTDAEAEDEEEEEEEEEEEAVADEDETEGWPSASRPSHRLCDPSEKPHKASPWSYLQRS